MWLGFIPINSYPNPFPGGFNPILFLKMGGLDYPSGFREDFNYSKKGHSGKNL